MQLALPGSILKGLELLESLNPEDIKLELQNTQKAVKYAKEKKSELDKEVNNLKFELGSKGQEGLTEKKQELSRTIQEAERNYIALEKRANAIKLAANALEGAASSARDIFLQPLTKHFEPYLNRLFPDARLLLNENFKIEMLDRDGYQEPFNQLSI